MALQACRCSDSFGGADALDEINRSRAVLLSFSVFLFDCFSLVAAQVNRKNEPLETLGADLNSGSGRTKGCLVGEKFGFYYCSIFRCYLSINI